MDLLYINNQRIDLKGELDLKITYQVNDIAQLDKQQSSYTNTIKVPRTKRNITLLGGLANKGDRSKMPYRKNECRYIKDGVTLIHNGWAIIKSTAQDYSIYIYEGVIDLFKDLENKTLGDLDISGADHIKDMSGIVDSFNNTLPYCYLIADYNGVTHTGNNINTQYLVPSVRVKYLWDKIQGKEKEEGKEEAKGGIGWEFTGKLFRDKKFKELWLTYPQPVLKEGQEPNKKVVEIAKENPSSKNNIFMRMYRTVGTIPAEEILKDTSYKQWDTVHTLDSEYVERINGGWELKVLKTGDYNLNCFLDGCLIGEYVTKTNNFLHSSKTDFYTRKLAVQIHIKTKEGEVKTELHVASNSNNGDLKIIESIRLKEGTSISFTLAAYESGTERVQYYPFFVGQTSYLGEILALRKIACSLVKLEEGPASFTEKLKEFKLTDFFREILWYNGLTVYTHPYNKTARFLTLKERIKQAKIYDFTDYYLDRTQEVYQINNYAQKNKLKHQYNDDKAEYNDGYIEIEDKNLDDEKSIIESNIYTYENEENSAFKIADENHKLKVYKIWEKEPKENNGKVEINYKSLNKRFYFLHSKETPLDKAIQLQSGTSLSAPLHSIPLADSTGLTFNEIANEDYAEMKEILNDTRIHTIELNLPLPILSNFDMQGLYYFKQENQYYFANKLTYSKGKTTAEMVRVKYTYQEPVPENPYVENTEQEHSTTEFLCMEDNTITLSEEDGNTLTLKYTHGNEVEYKAMEVTSENSPLVKIRLKPGKLNYGKGELTFHLSGILNSADTQHLFTFNLFQDPNLPISLVYEYKIKELPKAQNNTVNISESEVILDPSYFHFTDSDELPLQYLQFTALTIHPKAQLLLNNNPVLPGNKILVSDLEQGNLIYKLEIELTQQQSTLEWQGSSGSCYSNSAQLLLYKQESEPITTP